MEINEQKSFDLFLQEISLGLKTLFIQFITKIETENIIDIKYLKEENTSEEKLNTIIEFIINKNTVKSFKGDLSTNSLIKFYHHIIKEKAENSDKDDYISCFEKYLEDFLNKNNNIPNITKYEINNHYINIFIKDKSIINTEQENIDKINNKDSFIFNPIGTLISCFPEKFSSPRQGNLLELTRAKIVLKKNIDMHSFDGIENFTYIWVIYVFHLNQNFLVLCLLLIYLL